MIRQHPDIISGNSESHAYSLIYDPFTYLQKWKLKKRLKSWESVVKYYGLLPLLTGIKSDDIWRGLLRTYEIYRKGNKIGLHFFVTYAELEQTISEVRALPDHLLVELAGEVAVKDDLIRAQELIKRIFDKFYHQNSKNGQIFLEKTPRHLRYVGIILRQFPEAKVVEIIRDGRDVDVSHAARATNKQERWARKKTEGMIRQWKRCIQLGERFRADVEIADRIHLVRYENLRSDTRNELEKLYEFAGLSFSGTQLDEIISKTDISQVKNKGEGKHVRKGAIGEWRTRLSPRAISLWQELAGDILSDLGYETASSTEL